MKKIFAAIILCLMCTSFFAKGKNDNSNTKLYGRKFKHYYTQNKIDGKPVEFKEIWGWVMQNCENELGPLLPLTDIGYFSAEVDCYGQLTNVPNPSKLKKFKGRVHLVIVCNSYSLSHLVLDPHFGLLEKMIRDVIAATEKFDGLQVDYESIPVKDRENFIYFLERLNTECKKKGKIFSVCVPARTRTLREDTFPYRKIASLCDKLVVMAYDEHWSTSKPGPVASFSWCKRVANYATSVIPKEKLIMGIPFYGRSWGNASPSGGKYFFTVNQMIKKHDAEKVKYESGVPHVKIKMKVNVDCWFEDAFSTVQKMRMYHDRGINNIAFWRIGQEDPIVWNWMVIK